MASKLVHVKYEGGPWAGKVGYANNKPVLVPTPNTGGEYRYIGKTTERGEYVYRWVR